MLVKIRQTTGPQTDLQIQPEQTIREVMDLIAESIDIPAEHQRIVVSGRMISKDENLTQKVCDIPIISEGAVFHVIKSAKARTWPDAKKEVPVKNEEPPKLEETVPPTSQRTQQQAPPANPFSALGGNGFGSLMDNANMEQMLNDPSIRAMAQQMMSNPEMMRNLINNNPMIQSMARDNPELTEMMLTDESLEHAAQLMANPDMMQELARNIDSQTRNIESMPDGTERLVQASEQLPDIAELTNQLLGNDNSSVEEEEENDTNPWSADYFGGAQATPAPQNNQTQRTPAAPNIANAAPQTASAATPNASDMFAQAQRMMSNPQTMRALMEPEVQQAIQEIQHATSVLRRHGLLDAFGMDGASMGIPVPNMAPPAAAAGAPPAQPAPARLTVDQLRTKYSNELETLITMGIGMGPDEERVLRLLEQTGGNVTQVVNLLFS